jgi:hypothetical protein
LDVNSVIPEIGVMGVDSLLKIPRHVFHGVVMLTLIGERKLVHPLERHRANPSLIKVEVMPRYDKELRSAS